jgi:N12 class adenine-specific DNA methylase
MTIELTEADKKNGWTAEALEKYHKEREEARQEKIFEPRIVHPDMQKEYNPLRWRG